MLAAAKTNERSGTINPIPRLPLHTLDQPCSYVPLQHKDFTQTLPQVQMVLHGEIFSSSQKQGHPADHVSNLPFIFYCLTQ